MHNLNLAFEVAERDLDIPKMLDAEGKIGYQLDNCCVDCDFSIF